jgi:hypothetical protein
MLKQEEQLGSFLTAKNMGSLVSGVSNAEEETQLRMSLVYIHEKYKTGI